MSRDPQPTAVLFCTPETGHCQALRPLIAHLVGAGLSVQVFTHRDFRHLVERDGGRFVDLFGKYSLDEADDASKPIPCRYVSFAGQYAEQIIEDVRALRPAIVIYETFSVIGPVVARALGLPYVNVCVNHNPHPQRTLQALSGDERVAVSLKCYRAVERLRARFGLSDASPFSYVTGLSPLLNLYGEPAEFLDEQDRPVFAPLAFFGCLPEAVSPGEPSGSASYFLTQSPRVRKVYVSFGTIIWRYYARNALAALQAIADAAAQRDDLSVVISLGGAQVQPAAIAALETRNVQVHSLVNQGQILSEADLFVTHHGLNSTHEAIFQRVPMCSYPFFSDQPALAAKCQQLGLAIPLTQTLRGPLQPEHVQAALSRYFDTKPALQANLEIACSWERRTMDQRGEVIERILALIQPGRVREPLRSW